MQSHTVVHDHSEAQSSSTSSVNNANKQKTPFLKKWSIIERILIQINKENGLSG